jgi:hypothetical protein
MANSRLRSRALVSGNAPPSYPPGYHLVSGSRPDPELAGNYQFFSAERDLDPGYGEVAVLTGTALRPDSGCQSLFAEVTS